MNMPDVRYNERGNTAYINFSETTEKRKSLPVKDGNDEFAVVLDFSTGGELLGIELLAADVQLPQCLRGR